MSLRRDLPNKGYVKIIREYVDSKLREEGTVSKYTHKLKTRLTNVAAIALTGFALPNSVTPSFVKNVNDTVDITVVRNDNFARSFQFAFPSDSFSYQNPSYPVYDYVYTLSRLLSNALLTDSVFGFGQPDYVYFVVGASSEQKTVINAYGATLKEIRFDFASGPGNGQTAAIVMGFTNADVASVTDGASQLIVSPFATKLDLIQRVDIRIKEFPELEPFAVIYNTNAQFYGTVYNDLNLTRVQLLRQDTQRVFDRLHIELTIDGQPVVDDEDNDHSLSLTIWQISPEETVPRWLSQSFSL